VFSLKGVYFSNKGSSIMKQKRKPVKGETENKEKLTRREALQKMGYAAFSSSTMLLLLNNPTKVHAQSPNNPGEPGGPEFPDGNGDWDDDAWN
jgi:hypothetical protein